MLSIFNRKNFKNDDVKVLTLMLDKIEEFLDRDTNSIEIKKDHTISHEMEILYDKIKNIAYKLESKSINDLGVNGEMLILIEKMSDGNFTDKVQLKSDDPYLNYFAKSLNNIATKLHSNFMEMLYILKEYEKGVYIKTLSEDNFRDGEIKDLIKGINSLKNSITNILKDNFVYGYKLKDTSTALNSKMKKLVEASDNQSKILDDILYDISQIKENANQAREDTIKMQHSSTNIKTKVNQGLKYANETVEAMQDINIATEAISEAIEVIDQIAFQTNILSLNAAVEAATAGDAGKGFAVVASEVRNLASRSAEAAKSIKELVEKATQKANEGREISGNMIEGYNGLITHIDETIELIDKTTKASSQQSVAIDNMDATIQMLQKETKKYVDIAHQTNELGLNLNEISQKILDITDKTEFDGKSIILKEKNKEELELA